MIITKEYLRSHPDSIFVYGDNLLHRGKRGAASLRDEPNSYGFMTKKYPDYNYCSYYNQCDYLPILREEMLELEKKIKDFPDRTFLISKLGSGLANKYNIWDIIKPELYKLKKYSNVILLWEG